MNELMSVLSASGIDMNFGPVQGLVGMFGLPYLVLAGLCGYVVYGTLARK